MKIALDSEVIQGLLYMHYTVEDILAVDEDITPSGTNSCLQSALSTLVVMILMGLFWSIRCLVEPDACPHICIP